jgi:hypothetical protein
VHPLAHHAGEQALAPLLLLASGGVSLAAAYGRAWLAAARDKLSRPQAWPPSVAPNTSLVPPVPRTPPTTSGPGGASDPAPGAQAPFAES